MRKELRGKLTAYRPLVLIAVLWIWAVADVHGASVFVQQQLERCRCNHSNGAGELVSDIGSLDLADADAPLTIKQASEVSGSESHEPSSGASDGMQVNSGNTQTGQSRAKQVERPGVCNEHVPAPKGKMCSELGRNAERVAETTTHHGNKVYHHELTDCNTEFLFAYVDPNRFFKTTDWMPTLNQDGKVLRIHLRMNYVCTNRMLQGVIQGWT